jgi:hypothetical protein
MCDQILVNTNIQDYKVSLLKKDWYESCNCSLSWF